MRGEIETRGIGRIDRNAVEVRVSGERLNGGARLGLRATREEGVQGHNGKNAQGHNGKKEWNEIAKLQRCHRVALMDLHSEPDGAPTRKRRSG